MQGSQCPVRCARPKMLDRRGVSGICPLCTERVEPALSQLDVQQAARKDLAKQLRRELLHRWNFCDYTFPESYDDYVQIVKTKLNELGVIPEPQTSNVSIEEANQAGDSVITSTVDGLTALTPNPAVDNITPSSDRQSESWGPFSSFSQQEIDSIPQRADA